MMNIGNVKWIHVHSDEISQINEILKTYDFHEIIEEDLLEGHTQEKIDIYDDYLFIVLHFPKYNSVNRRYVMNEFDIILGKNFIITVTKYKTNHIERIRKEYEQEIKESESDEKYKITPYYILYKIVDVMYDKTIKMLIRSNKDIVEMEEGLFSSQKLNQNVLEDMMIKKRNYVVLKHAFIPQEEIITDLQKELPKLYEEDLDVYFEDALFKLDRIQSQITVLYETIEALADTYNGLLTIQTNAIVKLLTIITAIMGMLTLISGIYGMNVQLPTLRGYWTFALIISTMVIVSATFIYIFKKKKLL
ncbi:MAG: magnesium transporter CorA family protein [Candidatus Absconditabacteria bacterium]